MKFFNRNKYDGIIFPKEQVKFLNELKAMAFKEDLSILNENLEILYASDYKTFNLIKYFALISVLISSLGLYAISMFVAEKRFKEIGHPGQPAPTRIPAGLPHPGGGPA